jgi:hypothetical protein
MKISMEGRWKNTNKENPKHSGENLSLSQFVHHKPHIILLWLETGSLRGEARAMHSL